MNTSTNTNQIHDITTSTVGATAIGFVRRNVAGALLATAMAATAVGFAATGHADDAPPPPSIDAPAAIAPAPMGPWLPTFERFGGRWGLNCGFRNWQGPFQCW
jgi:hypothetical protein